MLQVSVDTSRDRLADFMIRLSLDLSVQDAFRMDPMAALKASGLSIEEQDLFLGDSHTPVLQAFNGENPLAPIPTVAVIVVNATRCF